jgi:hypothetical protein
LPKIKIRKSDLFNKTTELPAWSNPASSACPGISREQTQADFNLGDWTERQLRFLEAENHLARRRTVTMIVF